MDSILSSVKKSLGIGTSYDGFDEQIIMGINSALMVLNQLGIGPEAGFSISGLNETWSQITGVSTNLEGVKNYIFLKTKLMFDPPANSFLVNAIQDQIEELEWRLRLQGEPAEEA